MSCEIGPGNISTASQVCHSPVSTVLTSQWWGSTSGSTWLKYASDKDGRSEWDSKPPDRDIHKCWSNYCKSQHRQFNHSHNRSSGNIPTTYQSLYHQTCDYDNFENFNNKRSYDESFNERCHYFFNNYRPTYNQYGLNTTSNSSCNFYTISSNDKSSMTNNIGSRSPSNEVTEKHKK